MQAQPGRVGQPLDDRRRNLAKIQHDQSKSTRLQYKIQREGTVKGLEFETRARQQPKRALVELPILGQPYSLSGRS